MSLNRRDFLKYGALASAASFMPIDLVSSSQNTNLCILHTNDTHSRIDPFPATDSKYPNMGGVLGRMAMIESMRKSEQNLLLFDAGDIFQGTPYFNYFKGEIEIKLMSEMKYDAATMGNHDFDAGLDGFEKQLKHARFPFITSNYLFKNTVLEGRTVENEIFKRGQWKVGVFGLGIELDGLVQKIQFKETEYLDPVEVAQEQIKQLKRKGCNLIVCLSHLGYKYKNAKISDLLLAEKCPEINIIIGGHTHSFLENGHLIRHLDGKETLVVQTGWGGINLGKIIVEKKDNHIGFRSCESKEIRV